MNAKATAYARSSSILPNAIKIMQNLCFAPSGRARELIGYRGDAATQNYNSAIRHR